MGVFFPPGYPFFIGIANIFIIYTVFYPVTVFTMQLAKVILRIFFRLDINKTKEKCQTRMVLSALIGALQGRQFWVFSVCDPVAPLLDTLQGVFVKTVGIIDE